MNKQAIRKHLRSSKPAPAIKLVTYPVYDRKGRQIFVTIPPK